MVLGTFPEHSLSLCLLCSDSQYLNGGDQSAQDRYGQSHFAAVVEADSDSENERGVGDAFTVVRAKITATRHSALLLLLLLLCMPMCVLIILICC